MISVSLFQKLKVLKISKSELNYENLRFICKNAKNLENLDISYNSYVRDKYQNINNLFEILKNNPFLKLANSPLSSEIENLLNPKQSYTDDDSVIKELSKQLDPIVLPKTLKSLNIAHSNINILQLENLIIPVTLEEIDPSYNIIIPYFVNINSLTFSFHQFKSINLSNCEISSNFSFFSVCSKMKLLRNLIYLLILYRLILAI